MINIVLMNIQLHMLKGLIVLFILSSTNLYAQKFRCNPEDLANALLTALKSAKIDSFVALKPEVAQWRQIYPNETATLTDAQIYETAVLNPKLKQDFDNIMNSAKKNKVDLQKVEFKKLNKSNSDPVINVAQAFELVFTIDGKEYLLAYSALLHEGSYYLSEILISYDIFKKFK